MFGLLGVEEWRFQQRGGFSGLRLVRKTVRVCYGRLERMQNKLVFFFEEEDRLLLAGRGLDRIICKGAKVMGNANGWTRFAMVV